MRQKKTKKTLPVPRINCTSEKGGSAQLSDNPSIWASYAVAGVADLPRPELFYASVEMPDGHIVQFFVNRESGLVVVDYTHKNGKGGNELLRKTLDPIRQLAHCEKKAKPS